MPTSNSSGSRPASTTTGYLRPLSRNACPELLEERRGRSFSSTSRATTYSEAGDRLGRLRTHVARGVLERRQSFVIELARKHDCPVVVTLGGGYSDDAWRASSADFIRWLLTDETLVTEEDHAKEPLRAVHSDRPGARPVRPPASERRVHDH